MKSGNVAAIATRQNVASLATPPDTLSSLPTTLPLPTSTLCGTGEIPKSGFFSWDPHKTHSIRYHNSFNSSHTFFFKTFDLLNFLAPNGAMEVVII